MTETFEPRAQPRVQQWADLLQGGTEGILLRLIALTPPLTPGREDELSRVTLLLKNGRELTGNLIGRSEGRGQAYLLAGPSSSQRGRNELFVAEADSIAAVAIQNPEWFARCIEDERRPAPTKLELQRQAVEASKVFLATTGAPVELQIDFGGVPDSPSAYRTLAEVLRGSQVVLAELAKDEMGRTALGKLKTVRIGAGRALGVVVQGEVLDVRAPAGPGGTPGEPELRAAIESAL